MKNLKDLNIKTYTIKSNSWPSFRIDTINDMFIFIGPPTSEDDSSLSQWIDYFPIQFYYIKRLVNEVELYLDMDMLINDLAYILSITTHWPYAEIMNYYSRNNIGILSISNYTINRTNRYALSLDWGYSKEYKIGFQKTCDITSNGAKYYTEKNNDELAIYSKDYSTIRTYDMHKDIERLIKFTVLLFELKRKDMGLCNTMK